MSNLRMWQVVTFCGLSMIVGAGAALVGMALGRA